MLQKAAILCIFLWIETFGQTTNYPLCTQNAKADITFMIDATFSQSEIDLLYNVLTNFYANLSMSSRVVGYPPDFCTDQSYWNRYWNTRVSGLNYFKDTSKGNPPNYCVDSSQQLASTTKGIKPQNYNITSMSKIVQKASILLEQGCKCRRWVNSSNPKEVHSNEVNPNEVPQIMIWIPFTPNYDDPSSAFAQRTQLYSFRHSLLPYKFSQNDVAGNSMWKQMTQINLPYTPNSNRKDLVQALWDLLCQVTRAPGDRPIPADVWSPP